MDARDLALLGYSWKWVESGFLTLELLQAQVDWYHTSDDQCTEHYRYSTFFGVLQRAAFTGDDFRTYIELAESDPHEAMGTSALFGLMDHPGLTEAQREAMYEHPLPVGHQVLHRFYHQEEFP